MKSKGSRKRVSKGVASATPLPGQQHLFKGERLCDMPLPKGRVSKAQLIFKSGREAYLQFTNLEEPVVWSLALTRGITKADAPTVAAEFDVYG